MCSPVEIIEISDGEEETDMRLRSSAMYLLKKASKLLAKPMDSEQVVNFERSPFVNQKGYRYSKNKTRNRYIRSKAGQCHIYDRYNCEN